MKTGKLLGIGLLLFVSAAGWKISENLSTDALGLALGVIFGMLAGIPAALIALSANRQKPHQTINNYITVADQPEAARPPAALLSQSPAAVKPESVIVLPKRQERIEVRR